MGLAEVNDSQAKVPDSPQANASVPGFAAIRVGDRGLIAAPWTPLASLCVPLREKDEKTPRSALTSGGLS